LKFSYKPLLA